MASQPRFLLNNKQINEYAYLYVITKCTAAHCWIRLSDMMEILRGNIKNINSYYIQHSFVFVQFTPSLIALIFLLKDMTKVLQQLHIYRMLTDT